MSKLVDMFKLPLCLGLEVGKDTASSQAKMITTVQLPRNAMPYASRFV